MPKFNDGNPYHESDVIKKGQLKGSTGETDYFYFFCPKCPDEQIVRILEYGVHVEKTETENPYNKDCKSKAKYGFTLVFKLYCEECGHTDFVKLSNTGWQGGTLSEILAL